MTDDLKNKSTAELYQILAGKIVTTGQVALSQ